MRKSVCTQWFQNILQETSSGRGRWPRTNPAREFVRNAKSGQYDSLSDKTYSALLNEVEELSVFWQMAQSKNSYELLQAALEKIEIEPQKLQALAEVLSECYAESVAPFTPEDEIPDSEELYQEELELEWDEEEPDSPAQDPPHAEQAASEASPGGRSHHLPRPQTPEQMSPQQIYQFLAKQIYGQKEAVKAASMLLYNHLHHRKRNLLMAGPTGCGKTEIWRAAQKLYPQIRIVDSTAITMEGWSGSFKIRDIFADMEREEIQKSIVVFDEFDKFCEPRFGSGGTDYSQAGQNELLKLMEGGTISYPEDKGKPGLHFDSSHISFVFCGSFERLTEAKQEDLSPCSIGFGKPVEQSSAYELYRKPISPEDLVQYANIRLEIAGRINQVVQLSPLTAQDFENILLDASLSPLYQLELQYGVKLHLSSRSRSQLVQEAEKNHMGVRYLRSRLQQMLDDQIFLHCDQEEYQLDLPAQPEDPGMA